MAEFGDFSLNFSLDLLVLCSIMLSISKFKSHFFYKEIRNFIMNLKKAIEKREKSPEKRGVI